ncbi:unnamed protein product [Protopolystoma xenopodis]|uniref:Uncharacterized protein n=1 Tax=Protopolystoma xenopodis TaxID=117903 RepID=A0A3S5BNB0_9PLAT|nr:unnamed protein product [Protopolystoma xenopodis]
MFPYLVPHSPLSYFPLHSPPPPFFSILSTTFSSISSSSPSPRPHYLQHGALCPPSALISLLLSSLHSTLLYTHLPSPLYPPHPFLQQSFSSIFILPLYPLIRNIMYYHLFQQFLSIQLYTPLPLSILHTITSTFISFSSILLFYLLICLPLSDFLVCFLFLSPPLLPPHPLLHFALLHNILHALHLPVFGFIRCFLL